MTFLKIAAALLLFGATRVPYAEPSPLSADQARLLESVRASALHYTQTLPNFICTQITHRQTAFAKVHGDTEDGNFFATWGASHSNDVIEERLTFFGQKENYEVIAVNGKKVSGASHMQFQGAISAGEFGTALQGIFDPRSHAVFQRDGNASVHGRHVDVFGFTVPKEYGTIIILKKTGQQIAVSYTGQIFVDPNTLAVLRITSRLDLPADLPIHKAESLVEYMPEDVAGKKYNLPFRSELRMEDGSHVYINKIEFRNYHRFAVESTIHFGPENPR